MGFEIIVSAPVHAANKIYKSKKSIEIQQNSGLFCFQILAKNTIKKRSKRLIRATSRMKKNTPLLS